MAMPSQEELRRRLRAARVLLDVTIEGLAAALPPEAQLGERTLRKLENGETLLKPQICRELAGALRIPYEWFTVADIPACLVDDRTDARIVQLERDFSSRLADVERRIAADAPAPASGAAPQRSRVRRAPRSSRPGDGQ